MTKTFSNPTHLRNHPTLHNVDDLDNLIIVLHLQIQSIQMMLQKPDIFQTSQHLGFGLLSSVLRNNYIAWIADFVRVGADRQFGLAETSIGSLFRLLSQVRERVNVSKFLRQCELLGCTKGWWRRIWIVVCHFRMKL